MANILFVEADSVAVKAFTGIINRSAHSVKHVKGAHQALEALSGDAFYDLVISEMKLESGSGKGLLQAIRRHPYMDRQHMLIYTRVTDREAVRQVLMQDVQNYLIKPYDDEKVYNEINRAASSPWWREYFEPREVVCGRLSLEPDELRERFESIVEGLSQMPAKATQWIDNHTVIALKLEKLLAGSGFEVLREQLEVLFDAVRKEHNDRVQTILDSLPAAARLIEEYVKPGAHVLEDKASGSESEGDKPKSKTLRSTKVVANWEEVEQRLNKLEGYPVVESVAASFQMAARNNDIEVETLVHQIEIDPCLSAQVLYYTNNHSQFATKHGGRIEDPKQAIQMLGLTRIRAVAMSLDTIPDESLEFRGFNWRNYWMFQMGCAILSEDIVKMLSLQINPSLAYFAGLTHDLGKILLCHFYPDVYKNAIEYAFDTAIPLVDTEQHYFGCDHLQAGAHFAKISKMPQPMVSCIRYFEDPESAPLSNRELTSVVGLADYLCRYHEIGFSGSRVPRGIHSFPLHPAWTTLKPIMYHGFTIARFERAIKERVRSLKRELVGLADRHRI